LFLVEQGLVRKNKDGIFGEPLAQRCESCVIQFVSQVDIRNTGGESWVQWLEGWHLFQPILVNIKN
jgi:hypothetical protein